MGHETGIIKRKKQLFKHRSVVIAPHVPKNVQTDGGDIESVNQGRQAKRKNARAFHGSDENS